MRKILLILAVALAASAAFAEEGFVPASATYIEPLGQLDIPPGAVFSDTVMLKLYIDEEGNVTDTEIWLSSGSTAIDEAALVASKKCRFTPATENGEPVESYYQIYYKLSAFRTREYKSAEEMAETAEGKPKEANGGGK
ncbi:MAG: energy transducer TonB [Candidatus Zixiibacteriota bacterium]|jgi:TonB family protein